MNRYHLLDLTREIFVNNNFSVYEQFGEQLKAYLASRYPFLKGNPEELDHMYGEVIVIITDELNKPYSRLHQLVRDTQLPQNTVESRFNGYLSSIFLTVLNQKNPEWRRLKTFFKRLISYLENNPEITSYKVRRGNRNETYLIDVNEDPMEKIREYHMNKPEILESLERILFSDGHDWKEHILEKLQYLIHQHGILLMNDVLSLVYRYTKTEFINYDSDERDIPDPEAGSNSFLDGEDAIPPEAVFRATFQKIDQNFRANTRANAIYLFYQLLFNPHKRVEDICKELDIQTGSYSHLKDRLQELLAEPKFRGVLQPLLKELENNREFYKEIFFSTLKKYYPHHYQYFVERSGEWR